jgi:NAD(P)-dependent dehydrogenase (short-subunit alcohol dehydrogenase family)
MTSTKRLDQRVALVTGGARGIGAGIASRLSAEGAHVVIADIDEAEAKAMAGTLPNATSRRVDIADAASLSELAASVEHAYGHLDILVNNAAILDATPLADLTMERYQRVLDVNLNGALGMTFAMLPLLRRGGPSRRILNIASIMGVRGSRDSLAYSTAKGGIVNMTRCLACDLAADAINVNAICPGFIDTRMALLPDGSGHEHETDWFRDIYIRYRRIPMARSGKPADIAGPAYFLCSDDSAYVTGQILLVDGGVSSTF